MAKSAIVNIETTDTFQGWFDKTNELVGLMRDDVLTATLVGDTTIGNATLTGDFTATNVTVGTILTTDSITGTGAAIALDTPLTITAPANPICSTFLYGASGGRTRYTSGTVSWDVGMQDTIGNNFLIDTGAGQVKFLLSPAGTLTVPDLVVSGSITLGVDAILPQADLSSLDTDVLAEGAANFYYTEARANASIDGRVDKTFVDNLNVDADTLDTINSTSFVRNDVAGTQSLISNLTVNGNVNVTGDVTTAFSASDIRLKENILKIDNGLDKVLTLNGYTFNYIDKPEVKATGLVAQELEKVLPEAVYEFTNSDDETYKAIHYGNVVSILVEAIKELSDKIVELEKKI